MGNNCVFAVTVSAVGRIRILFKKGLSMTALEIIFSDLSMTVGTIHPACRFTGAVFLRIDIRMTFDTGDGFVSRFLNVFFFNC
jgi:hypothetical protein